MLITSSTRIFINRWSKKIIYIYKPNTRDFSLRSYQYLEYICIILGRKCKRNGNRIMKWIRNGKWLIQGNGLEDLMNAWVIWRISIDRARRLPSYSRSENNLSIRTFALSLISLYQAFSVISCRINRFWLAVGFFCI